MVHLGLDRIRSTWLADISSDFGHSFILKHESWSPVLIRPSHSSESTAVPVTARGREDVLPARCFAFSSANKVRLFRKHRS